MSVFSKQYVLIVFLYKAKIPFPDLFSAQKSWNVSISHQEIDSFCPESFLCLILSKLW